ncbi:unnamed protein product [Caenorhabditis auriculariae]|uniref:Bestrophin homolog n=1 Tax=Caenorhabditis auriculariae TaxID=2777116 RepID=A0A8S1HWY8_9PELO|nr:unnamed protein product [Caenorhabditis auriculariae]
MKVAEGLLNPLGEDDDDFEANYIIDRNIATGMAIVDDTHAFHPPIVVDKFADPSYKPSYSAESQARSNSQPLAGSATAVELAPSTEAVKMVHVEPVGKEIEPSSREGSLRRRFSEKLPRIRTSSETSNKKSQHAG